jgi:hypothetical protein
VAGFVVGRADEPQEQRADALAQTALARQRHVGPHGAVDAGTASARVRPIERLRRFAAPQPTAARTPVPVIRRLVGSGLVHGTPVTSARQGRGTIAFETARGYEVRFLTRARPQIYYQVEIPFGELDVVGDVGDGSSEESSEEPVRDVRLDDLPASVTLSGVTLDDWKGSGDNFVLAPTGAQYPHLTILGRNGDVDRIHFTSAAPQPGHVSVIRRGYRWNGMTSRLVADPEFDQSEQRLAIKARSATHVTFDLSGGRQNQQVGVAAVHVAVPSLAEVGTALGVPH